MFFDCGGRAADGLETLAEEDREQNGPEHFRTDYGDLGRIGGVRPFVPEVRRVPPRPAQQRGAWSLEETARAVRRRQRVLVREARRQALPPMPWRRRGLLLIVALLLLLAVCGGVERADASVGWRSSPASVFDVQREPALGCWPWYPRLLSSQLVVAHKRLACGTRVRICFRRCVTATVRDRGPYVGDREWDLGPAVQRAVRMPFGVFLVRARVIR